MAKQITLKIADLYINVEYSSDKIARLCRDYIADKSPADINVVYDHDACAAEAEQTGHGMAAAEFSNIYRQIAEKLPYYRRAVTHGAVVEYRGKGYMFIAKSGTGKTTHINLWREYFDGVRVINGDKPVLASVNNMVLAYGTPWSGKEWLQENRCAPLGGICLIKRAKQNSIRRLNSDEALKAIFRQIYMPENTESLNLTMKLVNDIIEFVPFYELCCDISREAAECSFNALTSD